MQKNNFNNYIDYLLILLLVGTTGFSFFYKFDFFIIVLFVISSITFFSRKLKFDNGFFVFIGFLIIIQIIQGIKFGYWPVYTFIGLHIRMFAAYFTIKSLGKSFIPLYVKFITFFSKISLIIFIPLAFSKPLVHFFVNNLAPVFSLSKFYTSALYSLSPNILIYNLGGHLYYLYPRNAGPFWEPGAFAGFLIIAIIFELIISNKLFSKKNIINIIALISTFSTTGYIAFGLLLFSFYLKRINAINILFLILFGFMAFQLYNKVPFLKDKIDSAIFVTEGNNRKETSITRFQSAIFDIQDFAKNPLVGMGRNYKTRYSNFKYGNIYMTHRNNGISNLLATYGIFFFILYWWLYYKGIKDVRIFYNAPKNSHLIFIFLMFVIGFSEAYFIRPLFFSFLFLQYTYDKKNIYNYTDIQQKKAT